MLITTKAKAEKKMLDTLFTGPRTATKRGRFDRGKYVGKPADFIGKEVQDLEGVIAVYPEMRRDKEGPYVALCCISYH